MATRFFVFLKFALFWLFILFGLNESGRAYVIEKPSVVLVSKAYSKLEDVRRFTVTTAQGISLGCEFDPRFPADHMTYIAKSNAQVTGSVVSASGALTEAQTSSQIRLEIGKKSNCRFVHLSAPIGTNITIERFRTGIREHDLLEYLRDIIIRAISPVSLVQLWPPFDTVVAPCFQNNAFSHLPTIRLCSELVAYLAENGQIPAVTFIALHELAHSLLYIYGLEGFDNEDEVDEFAVWWLGHPRLLPYTKESLDSAELFFASMSSDPVAEALAKQLNGSKHSISVERLRNIRKNLRSWSEIDKKWSKRLDPYRNGNKDWAAFLSAYSPSGATARPLRQMEFNRVSGRCVKFVVNGRDVTQKCASPEMGISQYVNGTFGFTYQLDEGDVFVLTGTPIPIRHRDRQVFRLEQFAYFHPVTNPKPKQSHAAIGQCEVLGPFNRPRVIKCINISQNSGITYEIEFLVAK